MGAEAYLKAYLTGGAANSDPLLSLGGAKSSTQIRAQTTTALSNVTGVVIHDAAGNGVGAGTLSYTASSTSLTWQDNGASAGTPVDVGTDGHYTITSSVTGHDLYVIVTAASLPGTNQSDSVTVAQADQALFDDWTGAETWAGTTQYLCIAVEAVSGIPDNVQLVAWIDTQAPGADTIEIGWDPAFDSDAVTIADINTAPAGVSFAETTDRGTAEGLSPGDPGTGGAFGNLWIKRSVPATTTTATAVDLSVLQFGVRVL